MAKKMTRAMKKKISVAMKARHAARRAAAEKPAPAINIMELKSPPTAMPKLPPAVSEAAAYLDRVGTNWSFAASPYITYAVKEGGDIYVCFGHDGSLNRQKVSEAGARKLLRDLTNILVV